MLDILRCMLRVLSSDINVSACMHVCMYWRKIIHFVSRMEIAVRIFFSEQLIDIPEAGFWFEDCGFDTICGPNIVIERHCIVGFVRDQWSSSNNASSGLRFCKAIAYVIKIIRIALISWYCINDLNNCLNQESIRNDAEDCDDSGRDISQYTGLIVSTMERAIAV